MDISKSEFQELLAHVIVRTNRLLGHGGQAFPLGLILRPDGKVDVSIGNYESWEQLDAVVSAMQASMARRVAEVPAVACCISAPEYGGDSVVVFLENHENDCLKVSIAISADEPMLDMQNLTLGEGAVRVFPIACS